MRQPVRYTALAVMVVLSLSATTGPSDAQDAARLSAADVAAINAGTQAFVKAALDKDWEALSQLYTQDAILNAPNAPSITGRQAVRAWFEAFPPMTHFTLGTVQVAGRGDLAYVYGTYTMTLVIPDAPGPIEDSGKYVEIRRKQPDGKWLISLDIFNSDLPAGH